MLKLQRDLLSQPASTESSEARSRAQARDERLRVLRLDLDSLARSLKSSIDATEALLSTSKSYVQPPHGDDVAAPADILTYAQRIRYTTFAHAGLVGQPPAPQQAQMLNSLLFKFSQERAADAKPDIGGVGRRPKKKEIAVREEPPTATAAAPTTSAPPATAIELPPLPPDWQPGDPLPAFPAGFVLPGMPAMPPNWKPGDPIPFLAAAAGAARSGEGAAPMEVDVVVPPPRAAAAAAPAVTTTASSLADFILNPDLEVAYDVSDDDDDEESDEF